MKKRIAVLIACVAWSAAVAAAPAYKETASEKDCQFNLAGSWSFQLDEKKLGVDQQLFSQKLSDTIALPGSTDQAGKGNLNQRQEYNRLTRRYLWTGWAWYQREIEIPADWAGKRVELFLERTKRARVWFNDKDCGEQESLVVPHVYELTAKAVPGRHRVTILVDNANLPPVGNSHQTAEHTQSNWNGILGRIELRATDSVWLDNVQVHPLYEERAFRVVATLGGQTVTGGTMQVAVGGRRVEAPIAAGARTAEATLVLGTDASTWDEWNPAFHRVAVTIQGKSAAGSFRDRREVSAGLRSFSAKGTQFAINGRTTFLRGKHDACVFPLTGYAPMDKEAWKKQMAISKTYGINHYRFHSWCPPAAAFEAADELGIYMHPELPYWGGYGDRKVFEYQLREGKRIIDTYGNHPSFVMLALGNELCGDGNQMQEVVSALRAHDQRRRLYAKGSNVALHAQKPGDDYMTMFRTKHRGGNVRGSYAHSDPPMGIIQSGPANTMSDLAEGIEGIAMPVIGHEIGQYQIFPDFKEIPRYTGVMEARNFMIMRDRMKQRGMLDQAEEFLQASGCLSALCYKADMELALRTKGFGGFQLLDLQDFPGQGTALIGILNAFMEPKGVVTPEEWRNSCDERVILARFSQYTWTTDQTFEASLQLFNYGKGSLPEAVIEWSLLDGNGTALRSGKTPAFSAEQGALVDAGKISIPLKGLSVPSKYRLSLSMKSGSIRVNNEYPIWVYENTPSKLASDSELKVSDRLDKPTLDHLSNGGTVMLFGSAELLIGSSVPGFFTPDFWCWPMFKNPSGIMGFLVNPTHPALARFPSGTHSDWQWFDIAMHSTPFVLDEMPAGYRPIVQVIDNFDRSHRLGLVDEYKYNGGRVLFVACELSKLEVSIAGRALVKSLHAYASSKEFKPSVDLPKRIEYRFLESVVDFKQIGAIATATSSDINFLPSNALDGDRNTRWSAADRDPNTSWQIELNRESKLSRITIEWEYPWGNCCKVEGSKDGKAWELLNESKFNETKFNEIYHQVAIWAPKPFRHIRVTTTQLLGERKASIREVQLWEQAQGQP